MYEARCFLCVDNWTDDQTIVRISCICTIFTIIHTILFLACVAQNGIVYLFNFYLFYLLFRSNFTSHRKKNKQAFHNQPKMSLFIFLWLALVEFYVQQYSVRFDQKINLMKRSKILCIHTYTHIRLHTKYTYAQNENIKKLEKASATERTSA